MRINPKESRTVTYTMIANYRASHKSFKGPSMITETITLTGTCHHPRCINPRIAVLANSCTPEHAILVDYSYSKEKA